MINKKIWLEIKTKLLSKMLFKRLIECPTRFILSSCHGIVLKKKHSDVYICTANYKFLHGHLDILENNIKFK